MREICYKVNHKRLHEKLYGIIDPLMEMFTLKPLPTPEAEAETKVTSPPPETKIAIMSGKKPVMEDEPIPLVLKTMDNSSKRMRLLGIA